MDFTFLKNYYYGNSLLSYLLFFLLFILFYYLIIFSKSKLLKKISNIAKKTDTKLDDVIIDNLMKIKNLEIIFVSLYISLKTLPYLNPKIETASTIIFLSVLIYRTIKIANDLIALSFERLTEEQTYTKSLEIIKTIIKILLWIIGSLFILHNAGFNVVSILAGIGIGGVAIALASQTILKDIFNFFVIILDKPFTIGDFILIPSINLSGTVEDIGLKTTKIRTLQGEISVITNSKITEEIIHNFSKMKERRVLIKIGVVYQTTIEKLKEINRILEEAVKKQKYVRFERANFVKFSDYSLDFELVYYVLSPDYLQYININEMILIDIAENFKKHSIEFAYPSQIIYLHKEEK